MPDTTVPARCGTPWWIDGRASFYTLLFVTALRERGIPARARCGFGTYFGTGQNEDHWVAEYFDADRDRWVLVDAQLDEVLRGVMPIDFDVLDVPRDRFVVAGDAWRQCRAGEAAPESFGFSGLDQAGYWWIAGNLIRDVAALAAMEMLPWDVWGAMPEPDVPIDDQPLGLLDHLAELTTDPAADLAELHRFYAEDERLRVPPKVFNVIRRVHEEVPHA